MLKYIWKFFRSASRNSWRRSSGLLSFRFVQKTLPEKYWKFFQMLVQEFIHLRFFQENILECFENISKKILDVPPEMLQKIFPKIPPKVRSVILSGLYTCFLEKSYMRKFFQTFLQELKKFLWKFFPQLYSKFSQEILCKFIQKLFQKLLYIILPGMFPKSFGF